MLQEVLAKGTDIPAIADTMRRTRFAEDEEIKWWWEAGPVDS